MEDDVNIGTVMAMKFLDEVRALADEYSLNFFIITDCAVAVSNNGNKAIEYINNCYKQWEKEQES